MKLCYDYYANFKLSLKWLCADTVFFLRTPLQLLQRNYTKCKPTFPHFSYNHMVATNCSLRGLVLTTSLILCPIWKTLWARFGPTSFLAFFFFPLLVSWFLTRYIFCYCVFIKRKGKLSFIEVVSSCRRGHCIWVVLVNSFLYLVSSCSLSGFNYVVRYPKQGPMVVCVWMSCMVFYRLLKFRHLEPEIWFWYCQPSELKLMNLFNFEF